QFKLIDRRAVVVLHIRHGDHAGGMGRLQSAGQGAQVLVVDHNLKLRPAYADVQQAEGRAAHAAGQLGDFFVAEFKLEAVAGDFAKVRQLQVVFEAGKHLLGV